MEKQEVEIYSDSITLGQFLKWAGLVENGKMAKRIIQAGEVKLNGYVEIRRGKQLQPGDVVEIHEVTLVVVQGEQEV